MFIWNLEGNIQDYKMFDVMFEFRVVVVGLSDFQKNIYFRFVLVFYLFNGDDFFVLFNFREKRKYRYFEKLKKLLNFIVILSVFKKIINSFVYLE